MSVEKCEHCGLKLDGKYTRCPNCNAPFDAVVGPTAREIYKETTRNRRYVKKLRRIGASNHEIANALGIKETDPVLQE